MHRIDTRPRQRNSRRAATQRSFPGHLKWLRGRPCCVAGSDCRGKIEAAHVDRAGGKGIGLKVADWHAVPMCSAHHAEYHHGAETFEKTHAVDLVEVAATYVARSPHRFIAERRARQEVRA